MRKFIFVSAAVKGKMRGTKKKLIAEHDKFQYPSITEYGEKFKE